MTENIETVESVAQDVQALVRQDQKTIPLDPDSMPPIEFLSSQGGIFNVKGEIVGADIDMIILATKRVSSYFEGAFEPGVKRFPDCISSDGIAPQANAPNPQHATCEGCPRSEWTEGERGKNKPPACKDRVKLVGIRLKDKIGTMSPGLTVLALGPVASLKKPMAGKESFSSYNYGVNTIEGKRVSEVVTSMHLAAQSYVTFKSSPIPEKVPKGALRMLAAASRIEADREPSPRSVEYAVEGTEGVKQEAAKRTVEGKASGKGRKF
jgi:hypothetical protein